MVFLTPISTLSKSMNTAIRVLLVFVVGIFTSDFRRAVTPGRRSAPAVLPSSMFQDACSEVVGLQEPGRGIEPTKYSLPGQFGGALRPAIQRLRILDLARDDARKFTALQELAPFAAPSGYLVFRRADRLFAAAARLHTEEVPIPARGNESEDAVVLRRQLDQNHALARTGEVVHLVRAAEQPACLRGGDDDHFVARQPRDADDLDAFARAREAAPGSRTRLDERLETESQAVAIARHRNRMNGRN